MALGGEEGAECAADEEGEGQPRKDHLRKARVSVQ